MSIGPSVIASTLLGGLFDRESGREANKAQLQANQATINAQRRSRDEARQDLTGTVGPVETTLIPGGGYESRFTRGSGPDILTGGDVFRAGAANKASRDFALTIPDVPSAQGIIDRDNTLEQSATDEAYDLATRRARQQGDPNSTNFNPNLLEALARVSDQTRTNREQNAYNLFQGSRASDVGNLQAQITANQALAPDIRGVGTTASAIGSQLPLPSRSIDSGATVGPAAASNFISQMLQAQAGERERENQFELIRALGNEGGFTNERPAVASLRRNALAPPGSAS